MRRVNARDGRKTAWVNDRRCSGEVLRALSETLIELHGQHDDRGLLNPKGHLDLLDAFADLADDRVETRRLWRELANAKNQLADLQVSIQAVKEEEDFLRHAVAELVELDPQTGEDEVLDAKRRLMQSAERIREDIAKASSIMGLEGAEGALGDAARWLEGVSDNAEGQLESAINALGRAMAELGDAQQGVEECLNNLNFNPHDLEIIEERLFAIRGLARKHQVQPDELPTLRVELSDKLSGIDAGDQKLADAMADLAKAQKLYDAAAKSLSQKRKAAAGRLDKQVMAELAPLKMDRAIFETKVEASNAGPSGTDAIAFTVATNPGAPAGPLAKIASGGELSRFLLALKVCLTDENAGLTMIFDEIDRGVGGATADAVGRRLASLADGGQVLVVTHSPQVAAKGAHHWQVSKKVTDNKTLTRVAPLDTDERVDEIARMISGDTITDAAKSAAKELLNG